MTIQPHTCFACEEGHYLEVIEDYDVALTEGEVLTVPKLLRFRCDKCGEEAIPPESSRRIEAAIDEHQDTLQPAAVRAFLAQFAVDQTEAAEALGMGSKTFHRWAKGTQRVSRSMGFFLRALMAHPEILIWIRERRWRVAEPKPRVGPPVRAGAYWLADIQIRFPACGGRTSGTDFIGAPRGGVGRFNPARSLQIANVR